MRLLVLTTISMLTCTSFIGGELASAPTQFPDYGLAAYLQTYGGWAIAALAIFALIYLYRDTSNQFKERHAEYVHLNTEAVKVMQSVAIAQTHMAQIMERIEKIMEQSTRQLSDQGVLLERAAKAISNCEHATK